MNGRYKYSCGHSRLNGSARDVIVNGICWDCKKELIGTRQTVVRYGDIPESGYSYNYSEGRCEAGVSVYFENQTHRSEFLNRPCKTFSAVIIGYGSDDEPLIDANTIE